MRSFITAAAIVGAASLVSAAPMNLSSKGTGVEILDKDVPFSQGADLKKIQDDAFGTLSDAPPPPKPFSDDTTTSIQLVAFNEITEAVYFQELVYNITNNLPGYDNLGPKREFILDTLKSIVAVEELHAINAENALKKVQKVDTIQPCKYNFPVDNFDAAILLAARFTDVVEGVLQDVILHAATAGDAPFTTGVAAALGDESEQVGWFRSIEGLRPNELPFLTRATREYAFSLLQDFVVPGSCPNAGEIKLPVFQPLSAADPKAQDGFIEFTFNFLKEVRAVPKGSIDNFADISSNFVQTYWNNQAYKHNNPLTITYLNQQNTPKSEPLRSLECNLQTGDCKACAFFPHDQFEMNGLVLAALTHDSQEIKTAEDMVKNTLFAPSALEPIEAPFGVQQQGQQQQPQQQQGHQQHGQRQHGHGFKA